MHRFRNTEISYLVFTDNIGIDKSKWSVSGIEVISSELLTKMKDMDNCDYFEIGNDRFIQINTVPVSEWNWNPEINM